MTLSGNSSCTSKPVDQRERWQALQSHLSAARASVDAGDRAKALDAIDAALGIDPDFLAAHSLRDRILAPPESGGHMGPPLQAQTGPTASRPFVSTDGYAKFEARAKRRRVDRRVDAARSALERRRLRDAAIALDEILELDPNLPELTELTTTFDELRRATATTRRGPWVAAAASFAIVLFGASSLQRPLESTQTAGVSTLVEAAPPTPFVETAIVEMSVAVPATPIGTSGTDAGNRELGFGTRPPETTNLEPRTANPESRVANPDLPRIPTPEPPIAAPVESLPGPIAPPPVAPPQVSSSTLPHAPDAPDEVGLVKQALQRYRNAYDGLDAQSAQAVYPAVNQAALARAFDGLESQTLTFDACDVQLRGEAATATCRGTARYVPKIGSREPRIEPRTWNFTLRKAGSDWTIDNARAER